MGAIQESDDEDRATGWVWGTKKERSRKTLRFEA